MQTGENEQGLRKILDLQSENKEKFAAFFKKHYQGYDIKETFGKIQQFITHAGN